MIIIDKKTGKGFIVSGIKRKPRVGEIEYDKESVRKTCKDCFVDFDKKYKRETTFRISGIQKGDEGIVKSTGTDL